MTTYYRIVHFNHDNDEKAKINFSDAFWGSYEYCLLIRKKVSKVSSIRLGHVASFQPLQSTTIQCAI